MRERERDQALQCAAFLFVRALVQQTDDFIDDPSTIDVFTGDFVDADSFSLLPTFTEPTPSELAAIGLDVGLCSTPSVELCCGLPPTPLEVGHCLVLSCLVLSCPVLSCLS